MAEEVLLVISTFADAEEARRIARTVVEEQLAACANIFPQIESIYRWKGNVETAAEALVLMKTTIGRYQALEERVKSLHSYEVPEIVCFRVSDGLPAYLDWVTQSCDGGAGG